MTLARRPRRDDKGRPVFQPPNAAMMRRSRDVHVAAVLRVAESKYLAQHPQTEVPDAFLAWLRREIQKRELFAAPRLGDPRLR